MRGEFHFGDCYQNRVFHSSETLLSQWPVCFGALTFSTMKHIKSKERNRLTDDTLFHLKQIGCTKIDIDIRPIVRQQEKKNKYPIRGEPDLGYLTRGVGHV